KANIMDFEVQSVIGRGKHAKVVLCKHNKTGRAYAIKVLLKSKKDPNAEILTENSMIESLILRQMAHPFIVTLYSAFQGKERLYLVMEYVSGGELYFHVSQYGRFEESRAHFYAAEIVLALEYLHAKNIVFCDLKLENIMLSRTGHVKLTDFGMARQLDATGRWYIDRNCTLEYMAPEVLLGAPFHFTSDWWSFGIVLFEMISGYHPFYCEDRERICELITTGVVEYPETVSAPARDLMRGLFVRNAEKRLGRAGHAARHHAYFQGVDWDAVLNLRPPPFVPELTNECDIRFFDEQFTSEPVNDWTPVRPSMLMSPTEAESRFTNFSYNAHPLV
ncbi:hypothetical protein CXG81DRAFT_10855, partial [Caulochytrium protostelioides]